MGGRGMNGIVFPLVILFLAVTLAVDSSVFSVEKDGVHMQKPSVRNWSDKTYAMAVGACTILGTLAFAYLLSVVMAPMLAQRYLYPLSAVAIVMLAVGSSRVLEPVELNLGFIILTFGLEFNITIASVIGVIIAFVVYRFIR